MSQKPDFQPLTPSYLIKTSPILCASSPKLVWDPLLHLPHAMPAPVQPTSSHLESRDSCLPPACLLLSPSSRAPDQISHCITPPNPPFSIHRRTKSKLAHGNKTSLLPIPSLLPALGLERNKQGRMLTVTTDDPCQIRSWGIRGLFMQ